jgi:GNAT superfamily N-acetyltransferase
MLFGDVPAAHVLLARTDGQVVGFAAYSFLWPAAGLTHSLYLKELYVGQAWRGRGVGTALMRRIREVAATAGCSRVEWTTDDDNSAAKRFYEALGAPVHPAKIFYRLEGGADSGSRPVDDVG